jgi:hypothetical protein
MLSHPDLRSGGTDSEACDLGSRIFPLVAYCVKRLKKQVDGAIGSYDLARLIESPAEGLTIDILVCAYDKWNRSFASFNVP